MSRVDTLLKAREEASETLSFSMTMRLKLFGGVSLANMFPHLTSLQVMYLRRSFITANYTINKLNQRKPRCRE